MTAMRTHRQSDDARMHERVKRAKILSRKLEKINKKTRRLRKPDDQPSRAIQVAQPERRSKSTAVHIGHFGPGADIACGDAQ